MPTPPFSSVVLIVLNLALLALLLWWIVRRLRAKWRRPAIPPPATPHGSTDVTVLATFTGIKGISPWLAVASNSLNPVLVIGPDYLEYRVLKRRRVPLAQIQSVRTLAAFRTVNLHFTFKSGPFTFTANVGNQDSARDILSRLDPALVEQQ
ncbi:MULTISPECIES: hypothetical protein [Brevundimonas]|uniref:hypothetical protein n=1 Tax=Brevundimonas pishanensis TaxID=2896315 RepID=UPI001FA71414|nr:hypothetical protein [Brevundimonas pishanensis]